METTATTFPVHTVDTAPPASRPTLEGLQASVGMVPNLAAAMATSPVLFRGFAELRRTYYDESGFDPVEVQVLSLTNAYENRCRYCMALHSAMARKEGLSEPSLEALRRGRAPVEPKLAALSDLSRQLVRHRGQAEPEVLEAFFAAGYTPPQALEVILGVAVSLLANFSHHLTEAPLDEVFRPYAWTPPAEPV